MTHAHTSTKFTLITLLALLAALTQPANAQPASSKTDLLKGPSVPVETQHALGSTDMTGHFTPVEGRPELAAFALLTDDPNNLAAARELDNKRIFELSAYLVDEIDAVREITDALTAGNETYAQLLLAQLRQRYEPALPRDPLAPQLLDMLTADQRAEFNRIINDYWLRWAQSQTDSMHMKPDSTTYKKIENQLNNELFQADISEAYDSSLKRYRDTLDAIYTAINPTTEQQAQIRELIIEHIKETKLKATTEQRLAIMLDIYHLLDQDRQEKLYLFMTRAAINQSN